MNDFTQEELVLLGCWSVNRYEQVGGDQAHSEGTIAVSHKIQDMIVNYCKHDWIIVGNHPWCIKCKMNYDLK
jgi:hypothetical protein